MKQKMKRAPSYKILFSPVQSLFKLQTKGFENLVEFANKRFQQSICFCIYSGGGGGDEYEAMVKVYKWWKLSTRQWQHLMTNSNSDNQQIKEYSQILNASNENLNYPPPYCEYHCLYFL